MQKRPLYICQMETPTLPGNDALLKRGAQPLSWPSENLEQSLVPLLRASQEIQQKQVEIALPPNQLSLLATLQ